MEILDEFEKELDAEAEAFDKIRDHWDKEMSDPDKRRAMAQERQWDPAVDKKLAVAMLMREELDRKLEVVKRDLKVVSASKLLRMKAKEQPYLIEGMIVEGAINCITASTNEGKSLLAWKMITDMALGEKFVGNFETKKTKTLILDLEMDRNEIIERLQAFVPEEACKNIGIIEGQTFDVENEKQYAELVGILNEGGYQMLVVDALSSFHTRDENSNTEMAKINKILLRLSREEGFTILFLHHDRKPYRGEVKTKHSPRGASIIIDNSNSQIILEGTWNRAEEKLVMRIKQGKTRKALRYPPIIVSCSYDKLTKKSEWKYVGVFEEDLIKSEQGKITVIKFLKEIEYMTYREMEEKAKDEGINIGKTNIRRAVKDLKELGTVGSKSAREINRSGSEKNFYLVKEEENQALNI